MQSAIVFDIIAHNRGARHNIFIKISLNFVKFHSIKKRTDCVLHRPPIVRFYNLTFGDWNCIQSVLFNISF